jgi:energy-converting hydrogenase Eha subunit E
VRPLLRILLVATAVLNAGDAVLHVAIDQVEPLRIAGNLVVIAGALGMLAIPSLRQPLVPIVVGAVSLVLNLVFIATSGIGALGAALVAVTTLLHAALALLLRRQNP